MVATLVGVVWLAKLQFTSEKTLVVEGAFVDGDIGRSQGSRLFSGVLSKIFLLIILNKFSRTKVEGNLLGRY